MEARSSACGQRPDQRAAEELRVDRPQLGQQQRNRGDPGDDVQALGDPVEVHGPRRPVEPGGRVLDEVADQPGDEAEQERDPEPESHPGGDPLMVGGTAEVLLARWLQPVEPGGQGGWRACRLSWSWVHQLGEPSAAGLADPPGRQPGGRRCRRHRVRAQPRPVEPAAAGPVGRGQANPAVAKACARRVHLDQGAARRPAAPAPASAAAPGHRRCRCCRRPAGRAASGPRPAAGRTRPGEWRARPPRSSASPPRRRRPCPARSHRARRAPPSAGPGRSRCRASARRSCPAAARRPGPGSRRQRSRRQADPLAGGQLQPALVAEQTRLEHRLDHRGASVS